MIISQNIEILNHSAVYLKLYVRCPLCLNFKAAAAAATSTRGQHELTQISLAPIARSFPDGMTVLADEGDCSHTRSVLLQAFGHISCGQGQKYRLDVRTIESWVEVGSWLNDCTRRDRNGSRRFLGKESPHLSFFHLFDTAFCCCCHGLIWIRVLKACLLNLCVLQPRGTTLGSKMVLGSNKDKIQKR